MSSWRFFIAPLESCVCFMMIKGNSMTILGNPMQYLGLTFLRLIFKLFHVCSNAISTIFIPKMTLLSPASGLIYHHLYLYSIFLLERRSKVVINQMLYSCVAIKIPCHYQDGTARASEYIYTHSQS